MSNAKTNDKANYYAKYYNVLLQNQKLANDWFILCKMETN